MFGYYVAGGLTCRFIFSYYLPMRWRQLKKQLVYFFLGEYFTDAVRITFSIVLPMWVLFMLNLPQIATSVGIGVLLIPMTDLPGIFKDKVKAFISSVLLLLVVSAVTCLVRPYPWLLGAVIVSFCFVFSMLTVFGNRYAMVGTAGIILMIFTIGLKPANTLIYCACIFAGCVWYYLVSLLQSKIWPLRSLKHAITECLATTAVFMKTRQLFYDPEVPLHKAYSKTIAMHASVNEKHEQVRQLLLRDSWVMNSGNVKGQQLLHIATLAIDLYEHIGAINYDYQTLRDRLKPTGTLGVISNMIALLADELDDISRALLAGRKYESSHEHNNEYHRLEHQLQSEITLADKVTSTVLTNLKDNLQNIARHVSSIKEIIAQKGGISVIENLQPDYKDLITPQQPGLVLIKKNLTIHSPVFRFSLRLAIACLFGYLLTFAFNLGNYSYWVLLTIVVIMKPAFSITKKRNLERLGGTLAGVAVGLLIMYFIDNTYVQLSISVLMLVGFFTYIRLNYIVSVLFLTASVVLCLNIYGGHQHRFIVERLYDTLIGCAVAYGAAYLFPVWEAKKLYSFMVDVLNANTSYLEVLFNDINGKPAGTTAYKVARKNVYAKLGSLSAAYQRMLAEPHHVDEDFVSKFQMLNHNVSSLTASYFPLNRTKAFTLSNISQFKALQQALNNLRYCLVSYPEKPNEQDVLKSAWHDNTALSMVEDNTADSYVAGIISTIKQCIRQLVKEESKLQGTGHL
jgi:uncharacterized membrane protein (TIGR01666 family)